MATKSKLNFSRLEQLSKETLAKAFAPLEKARRSSVPDHVKELEDLENFDGEWNHHKVETSPSKMGYSNWDETRLKGRNLN